MRARLASMGIAAVLVLCSTASVAPLQVRQQAPTPFDAEAVRWYAAFGRWIGKSNIVVADNGGRKELYMGSRAGFNDNDYWYALAYKPGTQSYEQVFVSSYLADPNPLGGIARIQVADVDPNPGEEILVALHDGRIEIYAVADKKWLREIVTGAREVAGLDIADLDGDHANEIIVCTATFPKGRLYVYSAGGALEWQVADVGGRDLVAAQMDADAALEIAVTDGSVVDAATHAVEWKLPAGFGFQLEASDIDGDGMDELIVAEVKHFVWAYDVDRQLAKWSIYVVNDINAIHVADIDADGLQELLVGETVQGGSILAYDTVTQALEWTISNPDHGVSDIATGDVDDDGKAELLWGAGPGSSGVSHLYVVDWTTKQIEWQNVHLDGPFVGPERADLDGDSLPEIVAASWESESYGSGRILVFDGRTFAPRGMSAPIVDNIALTGVHDLRLRDVDGDGRAEILVAADRVYHGVVEIYGFDASNTFTLKWTNATRPFGAPFYSVEAADIDGDTQLEIVAGTGDAEGIFVYVYDYATGVEEWHSSQMGGHLDRITGLQLGDTDGDGTLEIAGMVKGRDTYIFDGSTKELEAVLPGQGTALKLYGTSPVRLMVGDINGDIAAYQYRKGSYQEVYRRNLVAKPIDGFTVAADKTVWLGSDGTLRAMTLNGATLWQSARYGKLFGERTLPWSSTGGVLTAGSYAIIGFQRK